jgi:hypothetical protein
MVKYLKPAISFIILIFFLQGIHGQKSKDYQDFLAERFLRYCKIVPREEIFVHTDREDYISGEDLWFNIYLIDRQSSRPSENSKIAYFELLNQDNRPVVQKRIRLDKGFGPGQVVLPDTLSNGIYTLRVYTSWMKNFLPENCFMKNINIYNALRTKTNNGKFNITSKINIRAGAVHNNESANTGLALRVNNLLADTLELFVSATDAYRSGNNNIFYLFIQTHGIINYISTEKLFGKNCKIAIPKKELIPGINHITLFDSKLQPLNEMFIYSPEKKNENLTLRFPGNYKTRDRVILEILTDKVSETLLNGTNISISVYPETDGSALNDLNDYMVFGSEFGVPPWKSVAIEKLNELPSNLMDSILSTLKSNWIDWKAILSDDIPSFRYRIEKDDHYLSGKLVNSLTMTAKPDKFLFLSTPGKEAVIQYARTDNEGNFSFNIKIGEGVNDIIIQPDEIENSSIKTEPPFSEKYFQQELVTDTSKNVIPPYISKLSVNYQVGKIYGSSALGNPQAPLILQSELKRFYGKPDIELFLADYINLPVMQEVFYELLPGVFLRNRKSGYEISIADPLTNAVYNKQPLLLIDGVRIVDPSIIADLDPEIIEKIDVVKEMYLVGTNLFYGIVNVISKAGDYSCVTLPDYAIRMPYRVVDPILPFVSPDYSSVETKDSRVPDFRNTLYWNPSFRPNKDGKARIEFWTSDITSDYIINIQGITSDGKMFSFKKILKVE